MSPITSNDIKENEEAFKKQFDKNSQEYHAKNISSDSKELQPVPLGGQRIPEGMEDHANWKNLPIVMPPNDAGKGSPGQSLSPLDEACRKSDTFNSLMDLRNTLELAKKYLAAISRNAAILSRAKGLQTDNTSNGDKSNKDALPSAKPAVARPQSMSTQNAKKDMQDTLQCLKELKLYKVMPFDKDTEIDAELQKKCKQFVEQTEKTFFASVEIGIGCGSQDPSSVTVTDLSSKVTNATRDLFQSKNKLLNLIKEIKQQVATKYKIPVSVPATLQATPAA